jgi:type I restriction enzyme S subunit
MFKGSEAPGRARKIIKNGDVIFATIRPTLRRIAPIDRTLDGQIASTAFCILRPKRDLVDPGFLYFAVRDPKFVDAIGQHQRGSSYPAVTDKDILNESIPLPPLSEQRTIGGILWKIQQAIEVETNLIRVTRELKAAVMKKLFTEGLNGEPQKETEIGLVPESWHRAKIGDLGRVVTGTTPPTKNSNYYQCGDIPFIAPADINENARITMVQKRITQSGLSVSRPLPRGTTCFVCIGSSIGKVGITTDDISTTNQQINAVVPSDYFDSWFVYYLLAFHAHRVRAQASPSPVPILSKGNFEQIELYFAQDKEHQRALAKPLVTLDESLEYHVRKLKLLEELFSSALRALMSNTIRLKELDTYAICQDLKGVAA